MNDSAPLNDITIEAGDGLFPSPFDPGTLPPHEMTTTDWGKQLFSGLFQEEQSYTAVTGNVQGAVTIIWRYTFSDPEWKSPEFVVCPSLPASRSIPVRRRYWSFAKCYRRAKRFQKLRRIKRRQRRAAQRKHSKQ
jgi:hypothetical protein